MLQLTANILPHNPAILIIRNLCEADAAAACCRAVTVEREGGVVVEEVRLAFVVDDARVDGEAVSLFRHQFAGEGPRALNCRCDCVGDGLKGLAH